MSKALFDTNASIDIVSLPDWLAWCGGLRNDEYIVIPLIQRGSVWKPHQLVDLWDSLLRGLPVGSFMLQRMAATVDGREVLVRRPGRMSSERMEKDGYGLLDGQQRTLAMLTAWPGVEETDRRLWVDFADTPGREHLFRLRVTTENHPFGFQRDNPSQKLPLGQRKLAREAQCPEGQPDFRRTFPYRDGLAFMVDMRELIRFHMEARSFGEWFDRIATPAPSRLLTAPAAGVADTARAVYQALGRLRALQFPVIRLDIDSIESGTGAGANEDPALAILFKRVGANGTPLSNADYVFSVIKHHCPQVHDLVEQLHRPAASERDGNIAALLAPTEIVGTAVRLAAAACVDGKGKPLPDQVAIDKRLFQRLLSETVVQEGQEGLFLKLAFLPLLEDRERGLGGLLRRLAGLIRYRGAGDIGLPPHALWLLDRNLLQVLLYWLRTAGVAGEAREQVIRFVLFWAQCVTDTSRASEIAFREIRASAGAPAARVFHRLYWAIINENRALRLFPPQELKERIPRVLFADSGANKPLLGLSRFRQRDGEEVAETRARECYQHWWWGWQYQNPLLLWLQRDYVATLDGSPVAGREEDTPYDYDHLLPQSNWSDWQGVSATTPTSIQYYMAPHDRQYWILGNSIGNVRVWRASDNRSLGDAPPATRLDAEACLQSLVSPSNRELWLKCDGGERKREWTAARAICFQQAVEQRTFELYERYFNDLQFAEWTEAPPPE